MHSLNFFKHGKKALTLDLFLRSQWFLTRPSFDIVHVHFGPNAERVAFLKKIGFLKRSKLITTFHGFDLIPHKTEFYRKNYASLLRETSSFTVNSQYLKEVLLKLNPNPEIVHILPVGLDTDYFKRSEDKRSEDSFKLLFCGRLISLKGPIVALDIVRELMDRGYTNIKLTIVGDGTLKKEINLRIEELKLQEIVTLTGALAQNDVKEKMEQADVFIMPGIHDPNNMRAETQGLVIQEAQAMELPVIVSDVGGMKYGLLPEKTGFVVKEKDIGAFAYAIELLINNRQMGIEMGKLGREWVVANFDNKILVEKLIAIYNDILPVNNSK